MLNYTSAEFLFYFIFNVIKLKTLFPPLPIASLLSTPCSFSSASHRRTGLRLSGWADNNKHRDRFDVRSVYYNLRPPHELNPPGGGGVCGLLTPNFAERERGDRERKERSSSGDRRACSAADNPRTSPLFPRQAPVGLGFMFSVVFLFFRFGVDLARISARCRAVGLSSSPLFAAAVPGPRDYMLIPRTFLLHPALPEPSSVSRVFECFVSYWVDYFDVEHSLMILWV